MGPMEKFALENALIDTLLFIEAEVKPGPPPKSDAEPKAQDNVDALKMRLGIKKKYVGRAAPRKLLSTSSGVSSLTMGIIGVM